MKKVLCKAGIITGILLAAIGVLTICGVFGGSAASYKSAPSYYDSGYASFGADYYTYSVNNSAEAASAAKAAAKNLSEIVKLLKYTTGAFLIAAGCAISCGFGIIMPDNAEEKNEDKSTFVSTMNNSAVEYLKMTGSPASEVREEKPASTAKGNEETQPAIIPKKPPQAATAVKQVGQQENVMNQCKSCGRMFVTHYDVCPNCGAKME